MQGFWKWLVRANAKAILAGSVLLLLLSLGWWGRQEMTSAKAGPTLVLPSGEGLAARRMVRLGVLDYVNGQLELDPGRVPQTPFRPASSPRVVRDLSAAGGGGVDGGTVHIETKGVAAHVAPPVQADTPVAGGVQDVVASDGEGKRHGKRSMADGVVQQAASAPVMVAFNGIMTRPDGVVLAAITENGRMRFRRVGDTVAGTAVSAFDRQQLELELADGGRCKVSLGTPVSLLDGQVEEK